MNNPLIKQIIEARPGSFFGVTIRRKLKTRAGITDLIEKESVLTVRGGVSYDNLKKVIEGREDGSKPAENAGLPWGVWVKGMYPWKIIHNNKNYTRLTLVPGKFPQTCYRINGVMTTKNDILNYVLNSEVREDNKVPEVLTVLDDNIVRVVGAE